MKIQKKYFKNEICNKKFIKFIKIKKKKSLKIKNKNKLKYETDISFEK